MLDEKKTQMTMIQTARAARAAAPWPIIVGILLLAGCSSTSTRDEGLPTQPLIRNSPAPKPEVEKPMRADIGDATDPCPMRLQDLIGPIYEYYVLHKDLPPQLEDLRPLADVGQVIDFTCPASGRPYVYLRQGLLDHAKTRRLIIYDAAPSHFTMIKDKDGNPKRVAVRWGIVTTLPHGGAPIVMNVVPLTEAVFHTYAPGATEILTPPASGEAVPLGQN